VSRPYEQVVFGETETSNSGAVDGAIKFRAPMPKWADASSVQLGGFWARNSSSDRMDAQSETWGLDARVGLGKSGKLGPRHWYAGAETGPRWWSGLGTGMTAEVQGGIDLRPRWTLSGKLLFEDVPGSLGGGFLKTQVSVLVPLGKKRRLEIGLRETLMQPGDGDETMLMLGWRKEASVGR
jgi:hypothetical protein